MLLKLCNKKYEEQIYRIGLKKDTTLEITDNELQRGHKFI